AGGDGSAGSASKRSTSGRRAARGSPGAWLAPDELATNWLCSTTGGLPRLIEMRQQVLGDFVPVDLGQRDLHQVEVDALDLGRHAAADFLLELLRQELLGQLVD